MPAETPTPAAGPAAEWRAGATRVAYWENETASGERYGRTTLEFTYRLSEERREGKDDSGFRSTGSLPLDALIVARELLGRAIDFQLATQGASSK